MKSSMRRLAQSKAFVAGLAGVIVLLIAMIAALLLDPTSPTRTIKARVVALYVVDSKYGGRPRFVIESELTGRVSATPAFYVPLREGEYVTVQESESKIFGRKVYEVMAPAEDIGSARPANK